MDARFGYQNMASADSSVRIRPVIDAADVLVVSLCVVILRIMMQIL